MCQLSYCTIITGYELILHQAEEQWLKLVLFMVSSDSNHYGTLHYFGAQWSFTQKQADQSSILLSCICNLCNINAKLLTIIFVVDVAVSSESEFHECNVSHISETLLFWQSVHNCERKGPGRTLTYFQVGEQKLIHCG